MHSTRPFLLLVATLILAAACAPKRRFVDRPIAARETVAKFLDAMKESDVALMKEMIWPAYLEFNNIDIDDCHVHAYLISGYRIEDVSKDKATARVTFVFGPSRLLTFQVARYENRDYIFPGGHEGQRIDPWVEDIQLD